MQLDDAARDRRGRAPCRPSCACWCCRPAGTRRRSRAWSSGAMPGPVSTHRQLEAASPAWAARISTAALVGELDGIADQVEQHLRQPPRIAGAGRQARRHVGAELEALGAGERLGGRQHGRHHVGDAVVLDRQRELPGLDLGEVEHVVDQAEQVPAVALHALQHALRLLAARRRRARRPSSRCSRGWRSSGVRSSWLMLARNCDLCWLAISSWRLFSWISVNRRTFWMAITAWAAKVSSSSIWRGVKAPGSGLRSRMRRRRRPRAASARRATP